MSPTHKAAAVALAALALFALGFGLRGLVDPPSADAALAARVAALEQRLAATPSIERPTTGRPVRTDAVTPSTRPLSTAMADAGPVHADDGPGDAAPTREEIARVQSIRRAELESRFAAEPIDPAWAKVAERGLFDAAASDEVTMIGEVPAAFESSCRSRSCRVHATFAPGDDAESWLSLYLLGAADNIGQAESLVSMREDGSFEVTIYGRRP